MRTGRHIGQSKSCLGRLAELNPVRSDLLVNEVFRDAFTGRIGIPTKDDGLSGETLGRQEDRQDDCSEVHAVGLSGFGSAGKSALPGVIDYGLLKLRHALSALGKHPDSGRAVYPPISAVHSVPASHKACVHSRPALSWRTATATRRKLYIAVGKGYFHGLILLEMKIVIASAIRLPANPQINDPTHSASFMASKPVSQTCIKLRMQCRWLVR
jgi:hypothetical protein